MTTPEQTLDLERIRAETPGLSAPSAADRLFLNSAGSSLPPAPVVETLRAYLAREAEIGGYEAQAEMQGALDDFYAAFAALLGVAPDEIAFAENATRAWDMAFYAIPFEPGDRILTIEPEYASNALAFLQMAARRGVEIDVAPSDGAGLPDLDAMRALIGPRTRLIAATHAPTQDGLITPAAEIGALARAHGILYLLDICQSAGQIALDLPAIGCDMASGTGRKFLRGPRATGFLYVRADVRDRLEPPFIDLHSAEWTSERTYAWAPGARKFQNFEQFFAGKAALAAAARYALALGVEAIEARTAALAEELRGRLAEIRGVTVTDRGRRRSGIVTFAKADEPTAALQARLAAAGAAVTVSPAACARFDRARGAYPQGVVRASPHYFNTADEIARFAALVAAAPGGA